MMIGTNILKAQEILTTGGLVAIPTETVYGLGGNAFNPDAVLQIFATKQRPHTDPLIVHTNTLARVKTFVKSLPLQAQLLAEAFWPGPLTLLLTKKNCIPDIVTAGLPTVGVRIPKHPLTCALLQKLPFPLAAPSANPFGYISPTTAQHVADQLADLIPYILDGGQCALGIESTIVGFKDGVPMVYRLGGVTLEAMEKVVGKLQVYQKPKDTEKPLPLTPGMLASHYAPTTPVKIGSLPLLVKKYTQHKIGILAFRQAVQGIPRKHQVVLSAQGSLAQAAHNLFVGLRYLDSLALEVILTSYLPNEGLGKAINDRLRRASY